MTKPLLIGLTGYAGSGKDTVRSILEERYDYDGLAFADPIRDMLSALLDSMGLSDEWMTDRELKERDITGLGLSYRKMAQALGTEWGRALKESLWLDIAAAKIAMYRQYDSVGVVISDVRFPNEAEWVKAQGGVIWKIVRPGIEPVRAHASEDLIATLPYDYVIDNHGSLDLLPNAVAAALAACSLKDAA
jgi:hypothetical protein